MDFSERLRRLNDAIERGEVIRNQWTSEHGGRKLACLLATLAPEVVEQIVVAGDVRACPTDVMPTWFAHLVPWIDDAGSEGLWRGNIERFAALLAYPGYRCLDWAAFRERVLDACVAEAESHRGRSTVAAYGINRIREGRRSNLDNDALPLTMATSASILASGSLCSADRSAADRIITKILDAMQLGCEEAVRP